jgi:hypothetical protein
MYDSAGRAIGSMLHRNVDLLDTDGATILNGLSI